MNVITRWMDRSLGRRIAVLVSILLLAVGGTIFAISYFQVYQLTVKVASERLRVAGRQLADLLGRGPVQTTGTMAKTAANPLLATALTSRRAGDTGAAARLLRKDLPPNVQTVFALVDPRGIAALTVGQPENAEWFGAPNEPAREAPHAGPLTVLGDSALYFDMEVPILREGKFVGSLVQRSRVNLSAQGASTLSSLVGAGTQILIGSPGTGAWTDLAKVVSAPPEGLRTDSVSTLDWNGAPHLGLSLPVPGIPWNVVLLAPRAIVEAPVRGYLWRALLVTALAVAVGTLVAAGLGRRLARPIHDMTRRIESGEEGRLADESAPGEVGRLAGAFNAMVEQVSSSTRRLKESQTSLRAFVSHTSQGIWQIEFDPGLDTAAPPERQLDHWYDSSPLAQCNQALALMQGIELEGELGTIPLERLFPRDDPGSRELLRAFIAQGYRSSQAESLGERDGEVPRVFVNDMIGLVENGRLRRIWGTRRDVTLERMLEVRLAQSQRLESIGRLAGGVSHDFNNLLTVVLAHSELLLERLPEGSEERAGAEEIRQTALRAAQLTRQLLLFSRGQVARPGVLDLNQVVGSIEGMLRRMIGEDIALHLRPGADLPRIRADQSQIEQVIMNLIVNARDAMPKGGSLTIRTDAVDLDGEYVRLHPDAHLGQYVMLAITDTGIGMTPDVQQHAFEPFFTTKPTGSGTGLGLATVYGVVRQGGGNVAIYSEVGRGTTVKVFFPARPAGDLPEGSVVRPAAARHTGSETVLVIEDEPALRDMVRRALTSSGYVVVPAGEGTEALRLADELGDKIDLLLTDMILPGLSGRELVTEFRRRRPDLPVLIMSGYTGDTYPDLDALPQGVGYLEKPFSLAELRQRVREVLDSPGV